MDFKIPAITDLLAGARAMTVSIYSMRLSLPIARGYLLAVAISLGTALSVGAAEQKRLKEQTLERQTVIVQATDLATARSAIAKVGGEVTHELGIIG